MDMKKVPVKKFEVIEGYTIKYHANGKTRWSKGMMVDGKPNGYWEWYRPDGTIKRSGYFLNGETVGEWITYDSEGKVYKTTKRSPENHSPINKDNCPV
jgi:antitoxin component YwqK of YwqJK toxin-antitoxin module